MILNIPDSPVESFTWEFHKNPYAFNFYKLGRISNIENFPKFLSNAVVSCSCTAKELASIRNFLTNHPNVIEFRTILDQDISEMLPEEVQATRLQAVDHLALFRQKMMEIVGTDEVAISEVERVLA